MYKVISSGSSGNAVLYYESILLDCGIPYSLVKPFEKQLQIILLTHLHGDHFNFQTISKLLFNRPSLRIGCCEWMLPFLNGVKNVDVFKIGKVYNYGLFQISPLKLYHDVENCGYRIFKDGTKIFHATDTAHLDGISAKGYDLYALEHNYNEDTVFDIIREKEKRGEYAHQKGSINSHLSEQQAQDFYFKNKNETSQLIRLHESNFFKP